MIPKLFFFRFFLKQTLPGVRQMIVLNIDVKYLFSDHLLALLTITLKISKQTQLSSHCIPYLLHP